MTRDHNKEKRRMNLKEYFGAQHGNGILPTAEAGPG
jgi:hypothetical protein